MVFKCKHNWNDFMCIISMDFIYVIENKKMVLLLN